MIALVVGTGPTMWADLQAAQWIHYPALVAVNQAGVLLHDQPLYAWASAHPEMFAGWVPQRAAMQQRTPRPITPGVTQIVSRADAEHVTLVRDYGGRGSSGLYAVRYVLEVAEKIVLCGVPMTPEPHACGSLQWGDDPWTEAERHRVHWERLAPEWDGRVKSLSGWTRELLGPPSPEWVLGDV